MKDDLVNAMREDIRELAQLRAMKTRIENAYKYLGMEIHESSLAAAVEETILRYEAKCDENADLRKELTTYHKMWEHAIRERDALRAEVERLTAALKAERELSDRLAKALMSQSMRQDDGYICFCEHDDYDAAYREKMQGVTVVMHPDYCREAAAALETYRAAQEAKR